MTGKHECRFCGERFQKGWQMSVHVDKSHRGERRLRTVSCWACAEQIDPNVTNACSCGFVHPYIKLAHA
jgi:hypothetical protein